MGDSYNRAVEACRELVRWRINPYKCLYHNPNKYNLVEFARWTQRYLNCKIYLSLLEAAKITGYEPVPSHLLNRNGARDGYAARKIKIGKLMFYLVKPEEMSLTLQSNYDRFKTSIFSEK